MGVSRGPVVVTIDEVRLFGFDGLKRSAIGDAISAELTARFSQDGSVPAARNLAHADGGTIAANRGSSAAETGASIASAVHRLVKTPW